MLCKIGLCNILFLTIEKFLLHSCCFVWYRNWIFIQVLWLYNETKYVNFHNIMYHEIILHSLYNAVQTVRVRWPKHQVIRANTILWEFSTAGTLTELWSNFIYMSFCFTTKLESICISIYSGVNMINDSSLTSIAVSFSLSASNMQGLTSFNIPNRKRFRRQQQPNNSFNCKRSH